VIVLSAGHDNKFPGAVNPHYGIIEHYLALNIMDLVMEKYRHDARVFFVDFDQHARMFNRKEDSLNGKIEFINHLGTIEKVDLAIELHFNASPSHLGHGAECLYWQSEKTGSFSKEGKAFSDLFLPVLEEFDGKYDGRGNKHSAALAFLSQVNAPSVIIEPLFIDHEADVQNVLYQTGRINLAEAVCTCINLAIKELYDD